MTGARGDALEWALALARAPGERTALRQRPLPGGIQALLQLAAGGHRGALEAAMARTGETDARLVEAARFYLREVLFLPGADAYRMLGLSPDAGAEQIKAHHRLLQQWLHPDRHASDSDAIFAGRVNAAWNALRTPERRAEYDAGRAVATDAAPATARWAAPRVVADAPPAVDDPAARWRRRAPVLALFAACGVLGIAAVRDALRDPDGRYGIEAEQGAAAGRKPEAFALQLPTPRNTAPDPSAAPASPAVAATPRSAASRRAAQPEAPAKPPPRMAAVAPSPKPIAAAALPLPAVDRTAASRVQSQAKSTPVGVPQAVATPAATAAAAQAPARAAAADAPASLPIAASAHAPAVAASIPPERIRQAQRTGRQLLAFLSARGGAVPPIWDSLAAQQRALQLRDSLQARGGSRAGDPRWRVDHEDAALQAAFGDDAQVHAQLVWREQRWLVSGVAVELRP